MPKIIGLAGGSGAGKSTLAQALQSALGQRHCGILSQDSYYLGLPSHQEGSEHEWNFDHPDAIEWRMLGQHLDAFRHGQCAQVPSYDFTTHRRIGSEPLPPTPWLIVEGTLILSQSAILKKLDLKVYVEIPDAIRFERRCQRDITSRGRTREAVLQQLASTVQPMHQQFVMPSRSHADLVLQAGSVHAWVEAVRLHLMARHLWPT